MALEHEFILISKECLSVFFLFPCMVYASEESNNYDYRNENIQKSEDYEGISELTDDIIQELYEINDIDTYDNGETAIDISNAAKVFAYNSENIPYAARPDFLNLVNGQVYSQKEIYEKVNTYMTVYLVLRYFFIRKNKSF